LTSPNFFAVQNFFQRFLSWVSTSHRPGFLANPPVNARDGQ
jgi:hypothetical protein